MGVKAQKGKKQVRLAPVSYWKCFSALSCSNKHLMIKGAAHRITITYLPDFLKSLLDFFFFLASSTLEKCEFSRSFILSRQKTVKLRAKNYSSFDQGGLLSVRQSQ